MSERYVAWDESAMAKGLPWAVLDTEGPTAWREYVCECHTEEYAHLIAQALNAQEDARKRLEVGPAVAYRDANQNAPSTTDGGKAKGLE